MKTHTVGIIMNGVTGRMGTNQHLVRSILAIRQQGGVKLGADEAIMPEPILVGRNADKLKALAEAARHRAVHHRPGRRAGRPAATRVYFDALTTSLRVPRRPQGHRRRQAHLRRKAHGHHRRRRPGPVPARPRRRA